MRSPIKSAIASVCTLGLLGVLAASPSRADPSYTADTVIDLFSKNKAAIDTAKKLGGSRKVCFASDPDCGVPKPAKFDLLVNFEFNSDQLTAAARENLAQFAKALLDPKLKGTKFEIDGHTDATGTEMYNQGLSERRAKSVVDYLASLGIDRQTLTAHGFGTKQPRVTDPYSPENRRVETHLVD